MDYPPTILGIGLMAVSSFVGLVVWLVKDSRKAQSAITDRYFTHLEQQAAMHKDALDAFSVSMSRVGDNLEEHTHLLKAIADRQDRTCKAEITKADQMQKIS